MKMCLIAARTAFAIAILIILFGTFDAYVRRGHRSFSTHLSLQRTILNNYFENAPILIKTLRGEQVARTPVWLMRQAGRYMKAFRMYSDKYTFRSRSESAEIATILSLQPWKAFDLDAVIMFSDILTPLPAMGIEFDMVRATGPVISNPIKSTEDIDKMHHLTLELCEFKLPFIAEILTNLVGEIANRTTLIGFIGSPWTLAAYCVEGGTTKLCSKMKTLCLENPTAAHLLLQKLTASLEVYAEYQIKAGAQVIQIFDSWAHYLDESSYLSLSKQYVKQIVESLSRKYPHVPVVYFSNGGSLFVNHQTDIGAAALGLDWRRALHSVRREVGDDVVLMGNLDPALLLADVSSTQGEKRLRTAVRKCVRDGAVFVAETSESVASNSGSSGSSSCRSSYVGGDLSIRPGMGNTQGILRRNYILNLGHGVEQSTSEDAVRILVDEAKNC